MTIQTHSKTQDLTKTMSDCRLFLKPENVLTIQDLESDGRYLVKLKNGRLTRGLFHERDESQFTGDKRFAMQRRFQESYRQRPMSDTSFWKDIDVSLEDYYTGVLYALDHNFSKEELKAFLSISNLNNFVSDAAKDNAYYTLLCRLTLRWMRAADWNADEQKEWAHNLAMFSFSGATTATTSNIRLRHSTAFSSIEMKQLALQYPVIINEVFRFLAEEDLELSQDDQNEYIFDAFTRSVLADPSIPYNDLKGIDKTTTWGKRIHIPLLFMLNDPLTATSTDDRKTRMLNQLQVMSTRGASEILFSFLRHDPSSKQWDAFKQFCAMNPLTTNTPSYFSEVYSYASSYTLRKIYADEEGKRLQQSNTSAISKLHMKEHIQSLLRHCAYENNKQESERWFSLFTLSWMTDVDAEAQPWLTCLFNTFCKSGVPSSVTIPKEWTVTIYKTLEKLFSTVQSSKMIKQQLMLWRTVMLRMDDRTCLSLLSKNSAICLHVVSNPAHLVHWVKGLGIFSSADTLFAALQAMGFTIGSIQPFMNQLMTLERDTLPDCFFFKDLIGAIYKWSTIVSSSSSSSSSVLPSTMIFDKCSQECLWSLLIRSHCDLNDIDYIRNQLKSMSGLFPADMKEELSFVRLIKNMALTITDEWTLLSLFGLLETFTPDKTTQLQHVEYLITYLIRSKTPSSFLLRAFLSSTIDLSPCTRSFIRKSVYAILSDMAAFVNDESLVDWFLCSKQWIVHLTPETSDDLVSLQNVCKAAVKYRKYDNFVMIMKWMHSTSPQMYKSLSLHSEIFKYGVQSNHFICHPTFWLQDVLSLTNSTHLSTDELILDVLIRNHVMLKKHDGFRILWERVRKTGNTISETSLVRLIESTIQFQAHDYMEFMLKQTLITKQVMMTAFEYLIRKRHDPTHFNLFQHAAAAMNVALRLFVADPKFAWDDSYLPFLSKMPLNPYNDLLTNKSVQQAILAQKK